MKKLDNYDLKLAAGIGLRSDMKVVINEVIDRLNQSYEALKVKEVIEEQDKQFIEFDESYFTLDCIFAFLVACSIFTKRTYQEYFDALINMKLVVYDKLVI